VQLAFSRLASTAAAGVSERQVEEMTRELLHGMLKAWLDQNLPGLVERLVREEIARVARSGR
jgi:cell pole-organizing protein PopZ